jgi:mRNA-degrading endonuclease toxin of MazEF toxin-antitoxin module
MMRLTGASTESRSSQFTSSVARIYPCEAAIDLNGEPRKAMADQIATAGKQRLKSKLGDLAREDMLRIERAIRVQLGMSGLTSRSN